MTDDDADPWTSEERARAVATLIAELWAEEALHSPILALDIVSTPGGGQVRVTIDQHPDEEETIGDLPDRIIACRPTWRAAWRRDALEVIVATDLTPPSVGGPLIVPVLAHGRGGKTTRFYPLACWRHLGFYGSDAVGALHAALGSLLYAQPPSHVALAILDHGEITPLYRNVAHLVPLPDSPRETIERLAQAIKRGSHGDTRPLVLVVDPDTTILNRLCGIVARLQARPTTPVHLLIAQERVRSAGRDLYAVLPALIVSGGRGNTAVLPGQGGWPKRGEARLVGRGMRIEGRAITWDEAAIAAAVAELCGQPKNLPPVLWDPPMHLRTLLAAVGVLHEEPLAVDVDGIAPEDRIADAEPVANAELVKDAAPDGQGVLINDNDARETDVVSDSVLAAPASDDLPCIPGADARPTDAEPAASSVVTPALKPDAPTLLRTADASAPVVAGDVPAPIVSPEAASPPVTLAAIDAASDDDTNHPKRSSHAPDVAANTSASRRAALLRASRDAGSAAAPPAAHSPSAPDRPACRRAAAARSACACHTRRTTTDG